MNKTHGTLSGKVFETPKGFIAKPIGVGSNNIRCFPTRGEAVTYLRRISRLRERLIR